MKVKLLTTISFFTYQLSISQTEKLLKGKVHSETILLKDVEVINKTAQTSTRTNDLGEFSIVIKPQDSLIFFSKNYLFKRLKLSAKDIENNALIVNMAPKPEELDDVIIMTNIKAPKIIDNAYNRDEIRKIKIRKQFDDVTSRVNVYDGKINKAINYSHAIFDRPKKTIEVDERFKKLVLASCSPAFFINDLKIKPEEKELFLDFCDADPRSKKLLDNANILSTMDFLYAKNTEFQKLKSETKN